MGTLEEQKKEADKINNDLMINKQKAEKEITDADKEYNTQSAQAQKRADDMVRSAQQDYEQAEKQFSKQKVDARTEADRRLALVVKQRVHLHPHLPLILALSA